MVLWLLFCINMCFKCIFLFCIQICIKIVPKTFLFPIEQVTIQCPQESSPKTALKPKSSHFSLLFAKKSYLIRTIQCKLVTGINYIYNSILLYFQFFFIYLSKYVKSVATHFQFHTKMRTPHYSECKKATE